MSVANAERAGVSIFATFQQHAVGDLVPPPGPAGLVIVNPPYGDRLGNKGNLEGLYRSLGETLARRFRGWRVGLVTNEPRLASATALPFLKPIGPISHGGLRIALYRTDALR